MSLSDIKSLSDAVMSEAKRERERILSNAESLAQNARGQARVNAENESQAIVEEAKAKVQRLLEQTRATVRLEAQSLKLERRESLLNRVFDLASVRLDDVQSLDGYRAAALALVRDAVLHMEKVASLEILADAGTSAYLDDMTLAELGEELGCELVLGATLDERTGLVVQSRDGRQIYDNTLQARLNRYRSSLRASVFMILQGGSL